MKYASGHCGTVGDIYKGMFKNDMRHGQGICMFGSGAIYKGDWRDDKPHGQGLLYSGQCEVIEGRFYAGKVPNQKVRMMMSDGTYFEGPIVNNKRHGSNCYCLYENGEEFFGEFQ